MSVVIPNMSEKARPVFNRWNSQCGEAEEFLILCVPEGDIHFPIEHADTENGLEKTARMRVVRALKWKPPTSGSLFSWRGSMFLLCLLVVVVLVVGTCRCPGHSMDRKLEPDSSGSGGHGNANAPVDAPGGLLKPLSRVTRNTRVRNWRATFAHLKGPANQDQYQSVPNPGDSSITWLLWDPPGNLNIETANVRLNRVSGPWPLRRIQGLVVQSPGLYLVYSQVAIHGRQNDQTARHFDCSHQTIKIKDGRHTLLMKSLVTQNNGGFRFQPQSGAADPVLPSDTALQMGLFFLQRHEEIRVGHTQRCNHVTYKNNDKNSYFGLVKISNF